MITKKIKKILVYVVLSLGALTMLLPFYWMASTSLKTSGQALAMPPDFFPWPLQWGNYQKAFSEAPFGIYFVNSIIVATLTTIGEVITSILASFAFARLNFWGKDVLFTLLLGTMMIPFELLIIPNFVTLSNFGWIDTYMALIIPWLASIFSVFLLKQRFETIGDELYYAAKVDGASDWKFLWQILVPMSKSAIVTIAILKALSSWNVFLWPLLVTNSDEMRTLPVGLQAFTQEAETNFELLMAGSTFVILPVIIFYLIFQKQIISGVGQSGTKG